MIVAKASTNRKLGVVIPTTDTGHCLIRLNRDSLSCNDCELSRIPKNKAFCYSLDEKLLKAANI